MPSPYDTEAFKTRVNFAAGYISAGRETTRSFDTCFEMNDGVAVAQALYRRTLKNPDSNLAANLWRYLCRETVEREAEKHAGERDLEALARRLRDDRQRAWDQMRSEQIERKKESETFRSELTEIGEQLVIPGCERDADPHTGARQMSLF